MGTAVWKGLLRLGLLSIPVKLYRAAQAEKVSFRQVHKPTGARIRHSLCTDGSSVLPAPARRVRAVESAPAVQRSTSERPHAPTSAADLQPVELSRADVSKAYEYEKGRYVCISREELTDLIPSTARDADIRQFVQPADIDPMSVDITCFVVPDRSAERAYVLLREALCRSGLFGVAQITMHSRESVVVLRPSGNGIVAQTLFYEPEIRRERQYRGAASTVSPQELKLALRLIDQRTVTFEPMSYFDTYRQSVQALIRTRTAGEKAKVHSFEPDDAGSLLQTLEQSLSAAPLKRTSAKNVVAMSVSDSKARKKVAS